MEGMSQFPDKYFELAIVDPPYGIGDKFKSGVNSKMNFKEIVNKKWDIIPDEKYFSELKRICKNYIIWGGNNYKLDGARCFIVWDKGISENFSLAMCELAATNFDKNAKIIRMNVDKNKIHPTQKPVDLYRWLLQNYAKKGDKILDTHVGSGSSIIACIEEGFEYCGFEIDEDYYNAAQKRIKEFSDQLRLFVTA